MSSLANCAFAPLDRLADQRLPVLPEQIEGTEHDRVAAFNMAPSASPVLQAVEVAAAESSSTQTSPSSTWGLPPTLDSGKGARVFRAKRADLGGGATDASNGSAVYQQQQ